MSTQRDDVLLTQKQTLKKSSTESSILNQRSKNLLSNDKKSGYDIQTTKSVSNILHENDFIYIDDEENDPKYTYSKKYNNNNNNNNNNETIAKHLRRHTKIKQATEPNTLDDSLKQLTSYNTTNCVITNTNNNNDIIKNNKRSRLAHCNKLKTTKLYEKCQETNSQNFNVADGCDEDNVDDVCQNNIGRIEDLKGVKNNCHQEDVDDDNNDVDNDVYQKRVCLKDVYDKSNSLCDDSNNYDDTEFLQIKRADNRSMLVKQSNSKTYISGLPKNENNEINDNCIKRYNIDKKNIQTNRNEIDLPVMLVKNLNEITTTIPTTIANITSPNTTENLTCYKNDKNNIKQTKQVAELLVSDPLVVAGVITGDLDHDIKSESGNKCSDIMKFSLKEGNGGDHCCQNENVNEINESDMNKIMCNLDDNNPKMMINEKENDDTKNYSNKSDISIPDIDDEDDPYLELQMYLEKVKREINEVFEQYKIVNDELPRSLRSDNNTKNNKLSINETLYLENGTNSDKKLNKISSSKESKRLTTNIMSNTLSDADHRNCSLVKHQDNQQWQFLRQHNIQNIQHNKNKRSHDINNDVNIWASTILKELDNLMGSDKRINSKTMDNVSVNNEKNLKCSNILKPEKHTTIPLYSFNLDRPLLETSGIFNSKKPPIDLTRKTCNLVNNSSSNNNISNKGQMTSNVRQPEDTMTILKIEEDAIDDIGHIKTQTTGLTLNKKETNQQTGSLMNDSTKKGSTSTLWTSEESILRSVGAVDEDNKSTSSSACDEASGILSSGKSRNSLDSSGLDNENNESGIGTATPPKDLDLWKNLHTTNLNHEKTELITSSNIKGQFYKNEMGLTTEDHDLLEVLSQCDEVEDNKDFMCSDYDSVDFILTNEKITEIDDDFELIKSISSTPSNLRVQKENDFIVTSAEKAKFFGKDIKRKRPLCLPFQQELFQSNNSSNIRELPSPSSASLHSGHGNLVMQELTTKSSSAPILLKREKQKEDLLGPHNTLRYSRSQSDRYLAEFNMQRRASLTIKEYKFFRSFSQKVEYWPKRKAESLWRKMREKKIAEIEAIEACKWLRAAGFPQYAQMYEDLQFPIDLSNVAKDHPILENDPLQSLYRRLCILNRCATMRLDSNHKQHTKQKDDSDDEGFALSENWTFQPHSRRWSRIGEMGLETAPKQLQDKADSSSKDSSPERFDDDESNSVDLDLQMRPADSDSTTNDTNDNMTVRFRRSGSERLKDGARAFLRRVESIKSRRRKRQNREGLVISGPQVLDLSHINRKVTDLKCINVNAVSNPTSPIITPTNLFPRGHSINNDLKLQNECTYEKFLSPNHIPLTPKSAHSTRTSPLHFFTSSHMPHLIEGKSDDSSSYYSDSQESNNSSRLVVMRRQLSRNRRFLQRNTKIDDIGTHSDSECHQTISHGMIFKDANSNNTEFKIKKLNRGGSLNLGKESNKHREVFQSRSFRCRSAHKNQKQSDVNKEETKFSKSPVVRWHSFQTSQRPSFIFKKQISKKVNRKYGGTVFSAMSCGQLQLIRKLALVTLTGYMERYCPSHRSGWNWELPKFIKKIKTPDYRDKKVFGVPLLLNLQRSGHSLPKPIRTSINWLKKNALDQTGIFRKSGVKSRISKLKELIELTETDYFDLFDTQQAYDVADMLKQYFRDLPEALLTTKMSETFIAIFQHLPHDIRADAIQSAVLLLPDENREVLFTLLEFLSQVVDNCQFNQMTANNLAVCLAPSLFSNHMTNGGRSSSVSPRRRKITGVPDFKELSETRASHECLAFMISNYKDIFTASREKILRCNFGYMEESKPVPLEALGEGMQFHNWRGYLYECTSATIKEGRERSRGWITISSLDQNIEIAYKKVGDGHPLRLWRCTTEIDAPTQIVRKYILNERHLWDANLLKSQTVQILDERTEIFQYACDGQTITDYCVLRSWQQDLPKGACVIVETSVDHPDASLLFGGVRGVVLASRYLIEPIGTGRAKLMHLARVDTKGKTPEWYNKSYGHISSQYLSNIRSAFQRNNEVNEHKT